MTAKQMIMALSLMGVARGGLQPTPHGRIAAEVPPLISLGLGMLGERDAAPIVGACECHSPFAQAMIIGGDRILSVDGIKVRSVQEVSRALGLARSKRSIQFVILRAIRFEGTPPETVIVEFPPNWWLAKPKKE
jgi:membrane-associated protease RseP (regulator of RpoE activity)